VICRRARVVYGDKGENRDLAPCDKTASLSGGGGSLGGNSSPTAKVILSCWRS